MQKRKFELNYEQIYLDAKSQGVEIRLEDELYSFAKLIEDNYDFKLFLEDSRIAADYKKKRLDEICPPGMTNNFFAVIHALIDHNREDLVKEISRSFTKMLFKDKGILFGQVSTVHEVPPELQERLRKVMEKIEKCPVKLRYSIDTNLLGGLCIKFINGEVWDVSLMHKLSDLKDAILK